MHALSSKIYVCFRVDQIPECVGEEGTRDVWEVIVAYLCYKDADCARPVVYGNVQLVENTRERQSEQCEPVQHCTTQEHVSRASVAMD